MIRQFLKPLELSEDKISRFLQNFPEFKKTLQLAVINEESAPSYTDYQGWQWSDVETHHTKLLRLVTEGITRINLKTRNGTHYLLKDRESVKRALNPIKG